MAFELTREFVEQIEEAVENRNDAFIREALDELYPADIANLLNEIDEDQAKYVLDALGRETGAEVISNLDPYMRTDFLARKFTSKK